MESIADRLQKIIKNEGGNAAAFARKADILPGTLNNYLKGRKPNIDTIINICEAYGINVTWLLTGEGSMFKEKCDARAIAADSHQIPLISWIQAAEFAETERWSGRTTEFVSSSKPMGNRSFALKVTGTSMAPRYHPGDIIFIDPDREYSSGDPCVIIADRGATFKIFRKEGDTIVLEPMNEKYPIQVIRKSDNIRVIGRVVFMIPGDYINGLIRKVER